MSPGLEVMCAVAQFVATRAKKTMKRKRAPLVLSEDWPKSLNWDQRILEQVSLLTQDYHLVAITEPFDDHHSKWSNALSIFTEMKPIRGIEFRVASVSNIGRGLVFMKFQNSKSRDEKRRLHVIQFLASSTSKFPVLCTLQDFRSQFAATTPQVTIGTSVQALTTSTCASRLAHQVSNRSGLCSFDSSVFDCDWKHAVKGGIILAHFKMDKTLFMLKHLESYTNVLFIGSKFDKLMVSEHLPTNCQFVYREHLSPLVSQRWECLVIDDYSILTESTLSSILEINADTIWLLGEFYHFERAFKLLKLDKVFGNRLWSDWVRDKLSFELLTSDPKSAFRFIQPCTVLKIADVPRQPNFPFEQALISVRECLDTGKDCSDLIDLLLLAESGSDYDLIEFSKRLLYFSDNRRPGGKTFIPIGQYSELTCDDTTQLDETCMICLEKTASPVRDIGCQHFFCYTCLVDWNDIQSCCPLCKSEFSRIIRSAFGPAPHIRDYAREMVTCEAQFHIMKLFCEEWFGDPWSTRLLIVVCVDAVNAQFMEWVKSVYSVYFLRPHNEPRKVLLDIRRSQVVFTSIHNLGYLSNLREFSHVLWANLNTKILKPRSFYSLCFVNHKSIVVTNYGMSQFLFSKGARTGDDPAVLLRQYQEFLGQ
jgi:hypothetical protein